MVSTGSLSLICRLSRLAVVIAALAAFGSSLLFSQNFTASISGTVRDATGAVVPGTAITVKHVDTGLTRAVQSDANGLFQVPSIPVGAYEVTGEKTGFRREVRRGIDLAVAQEAVVDFTMQVGSVEQQVTVTDAAPLVNTTLASTSGLITEAQVKDLPLNGRSFDQLLAINAGVINNTSNIAQGNGFTGFSVAGKRQETNRFMINGVDWVGGNSTGQFITPTGASGQLLGVDAVREYNLIEHTYGAEYGKRAGGQVSVVTSSGTNQIHGSLFEFLRNSALDARGTFEPTIGPFKRNQFGGTLGGPIKKDKLFLFGNYEGFRQRLAASSRSVVPDANARLGLLADGSPVPRLERRMLPFINAFWPAPNGERLAAAAGQPGTAYNYSSAVQSNDENFGLARLDYIMSNKDTLAANYTYDSGNRSVPRQNPNWLNVEDLRTQTVSMQETRVFSPTVVNVATLGYARTYSTLIRNPAFSVPSSLLFLPGGNPGSITVGGGTSTVSSSVVAPAEGINLVRGIREYYTVADDLHWVRGKHTFSAGGWLQRVHQNLVGAAQSSAGTAAYATMLTLLQDIPSNFSLNRNPVALGYRQLEAAWYVQDEVKLFPNLTIRVGLRDELTDGWNEVTGRCSNYTFGPNFVISNNPAIGGSCLQQNRAKSLWQPRVGIAWDPTGKGTWSVRAGFGIHNDLQDSLGNRTYANPPFNAREQIAGSLFSIIPLVPTTALPPSCTPGGVCPIYTPGGVDPNLSSPTIQQWSFTIERKITNDTMLQVGYVGSQSYHMPLNVNANTAPPQVCNLPQGCVSGGSTTGASGAPVAANLRGLVPMGTSYMPPAFRPNPNIGAGQTWFNEGTSSYHALNLSFTKRASHGLSFKANYSYAKVMDLNSAILAPSAGNEPSVIFSPYLRFLNRGVASYSLNHAFNANFSYQLPFGKGKAFGDSAPWLVEKLIGGWQWNGILTATGGFPFTPLAGSNTSGTGDTNQADVPDWNPNFKGPVILGDRNQWFDPRAFKLPVQGTFGNVSRGSLRGPGLANVDTSFFKKIPINERVNMQLRMEIFNVFNHANYAFPTEIVFAGTSFSSSAGAITYTATSSRQIQFALKLMF